MEDFVELYPPSDDFVAVSEDGDPVWTVASIENNIKWLRNDGSHELASISDDDFELENFYFKTEADAHNYAFHYYAQYNVGGRNVPYPYIEDWAVATRAGDNEPVIEPDEFVDDVTDVDEDGLEIEYQSVDDEGQIAYEAEHVKELFLEEFSENYLKFMRDKLGPEADEILWMAFHRGYIIRGYDDAV